MSSANEDTAKANAERLKLEGNALHAKRDYDGSYEKYSQAIKEDPKNAILWCNRAASCIAMKRYMDAATDAQKATTLDPGYTKAWVRLAAARHNMNSWTQSIEAWKSALKTLPTGRALSAQEKALKADAEEGLRKAQAATKRPSNVQAVQMNDMPWIRALALSNEFNAASQPSSAFAIVDAYNNWKDGLSILDQQQIVNVGGQKGMTGPFGAIEALSNAIMCDPRIFHIPRVDFIQKYNQQVIMEARTVGAWQEGGPRVIQEQAKKRLRQSGWDKLRPALSVTIRAWILRAFVLLKDKKVLGEWMAMAIEMLEWGRKEWKDVPKEDRGTIFDDTFLLGVRRLYLSGLVESLGFVGQVDTVPEEKLKEIQKVANTILDETSESKHSAYAWGPGGSVEFGFWVSFWLHPRGEAQASLAWREMRIGNRKRLPVKERLEHYGEAAELYRDAAQCFPKDDEQHLMYRISALEALWFSKAPLDITLPYAREIKPLIPGVKRLWGGWNTFQQLVDRAAAAEEFAEQAQKALDDGDVTLENSLFPDFVTKSLAQSK